MISKYLSAILMMVLFIVMSVNYVKSDQELELNETQVMNASTSLTDDFISQITYRIPFADDIEFIHAFIESLAVIVVSELGDKTFFIAAIMSMRYSKFPVFFGALSALGMMTAISVGFGLAATIIPRVYTYYISTALLAISGLKMLLDAYSMSPDDTKKEYEEVQSDLNRREMTIRKRYISTANNNSSPKPSEAELQYNYSKVRNESNGNGSSGAATEKDEYDMARVLMQAFSMTLLAEWGDRSQLTTIVLSAKENAWGVITGGIVGHAVCTGLAIMCGTMIAQRISVRTVTFFGGILFLMFAVAALVYDPDSDNTIVIE